MRALLVAGILAASLLAGCSGSSDSGQSVSGPILQYDDGAANKVDVPLLNATPPAPGERTLQKVPQWRLGEWWDYTMTDHFMEKTITIKRVVAGTFGTQYLVGFPIDSFSNDALVLHVPGYGDIQQSDLSFDTHDVNTAMLNFPLTQGKSWPSAFEGRKGTATVVSVTDNQATITFNDAPTNSYNWTATYDAQTGEIVTLNDPFYAEYHVTAHGYGYSGVVRVPHAHDLVFQNGRLGPFDARTSPVSNPTPAPAQETVQVAPGYDRLAFVILVGGGPNFLVGGPLPNVPTSGGTYDEKVTSPNGTVYELSEGPTEQGLKAQFFGADNPTGTWTLNHAADGPGIVLTEGIGYHSIDVQLPTGCVLPGPNAGHHLNPCTGKMGGGMGTMTASSKSA